MVSIIYTRNVTYYNYYKRVLISANLYYRYNYKLHPRLFKNTYECTFGSMLRKQLQANPFPDSELSIQPYRSTTFDTFVLMANPYPNIPYSGYISRV